MLYFFRSNKCALLLFFLKGVGADSCCCFVAVTGVVRAVACVVDLGIATLCL